MVPGHPSAQLSTSSIAVLAALGLVAICAFGYSVFWVQNRARQGILIGNANSPVPFEAPPGVCWAFALATLAELCASQFSGFEALALVYYSQVFLGLLALAFYSRQKDPFGWLRLNLARVPIYGVIGGCAIFVGTSVITSTEQQLASHFYTNGLEEQAVVKLLRQMKNATLIINFFMNAVVLAPLAEELFFRGFLYTALKKRLRPVVAICISGTIFGMIHWSPFGFIPLSCMGMALALVYETTGSILASMAVHACFNLISCLLILFPSFLDAK